LGWPAATTRPWGGCAATPMAYGVARQPPMAYGMACGAPWAGDSLRGHPLGGGWLAWPPTGVVPPHPSLFLSHLSSYHPPNPSPSSNLSPCTNHSPSVRLDPAFAATLVCCLGFRSRGNLPIAPPLRLRKPSLPRGWSCCHPQPSGWLAWTPLGRGCHRGHP
jgi:hypothetical protein